MEIKHAQEPDDEEQARGYAKPEIRHLQPSCRGERQLLPDQHESDCNRADQREGAEMMEEANSVDIRAAISPDAR